MIRELQSAAVLNNRGYDVGDYFTPERDFIPEAFNPQQLCFDRPTEACQSISQNSWGFAIDDDLFKASYLKKQIDLILARGGNYLLGAAPDADGTIPATQQEVFGRMSDWFKAVRSSFPEEFEPIELANNSILAIRTINTIYVHCPFGLDSDALTLKPLLDVPKKVTLLNTKATIDFTNEETIYGRGGGRFLRLRHIPDCETPVFRVDLF